MSATVTDLFCGAGGSSLGAEAAGMRLVMAANHWSTAIDVHQAHFPDARHDCADISQADPRRYTVTDILLASPECTNHSQARGVSRRRQDSSLFDSADLAAERSRATMWDVPRFAEQNRYAAVVTENVVEATKWVMWPAWWQAMELLGYRGTVLSHNSQDHGVPQSRDRIYVVWVRNGLNVDLEMERSAWCDRCDSVTVCRQAWKNGRTVGRYRTQWVWACSTCHRQVDPSVRPAADIIDWSLDCPRIGDRPKPLADKTRARIAAGLERYGWTAPITPPGAFLIQQREGTDRRVKELSEPLPTCTAEGQNHALVVPLRNNGNAYDSTAEPLGAVTAGGNHHGLIVMNDHNNRAIDVDAEPLPTVTTGNRHGLLMRNNTGGGEMVTPVTEPTRTMTTKGAQSFLMPYYGSSIPHTTDQPIGTQITRDRHALVDVKRAVADCGFRMLEPYEVAAAQAFPVDYIPRTLTKKAQVKLAGNAVPPPVMQFVSGRVAEALEAA